MTISASRRARCAPPYPRSICCSTRNASRRYRRRTAGKCTRGRHQASIFKLATSSESIMSSLQEQLLKAGLVDEKKLKQAAKEKQKRSNQSRKSAGKSAAKRNPAPQ